MKRLTRWAGLGLAGLATVVVAVALGGLAASEVVIRRSYPKPPVRIAAAVDPGAVARGRKVATVAGCHDCHGADFAGRLFHDEPSLLRAWAPNLTLAAATQSDEDLDRAIRHGVAADGRGLWVMPSEAFARLTDAEAADLLAYLRTFRPTGRPQPAIQVGPVGRLGVLMGKFDSAPAMVRARHDVTPPFVGARHEPGRRLARACIECHGADLTGGEALGAPDLAIAGAYDLADFERLLRTGVAAGDRRLGLMSEIAPARFNALSHAEIAALHDYLRARADQVL